MTTPRCGTLFHFTHVNNLPAILEQGELLCDGHVAAQGSLVAEAGDPAIKERRRRMRVGCAPGGVVADYVPFYFAARSPMMYKLWRGGVSSFTGDIRDLVYLVSDVETVVSSGARYVISDRNAAVAVADFSNDERCLGNLRSPNPMSDFVDWPLMRARYWSDTLDDPDRMERRMAEFMVHEKLPLDWLTGAVVHREVVRTSVERMFGSHGLAIPVDIEPGWYYP